MKITLQLRKRSIAASLLAPLIMLFLLGSSQALAASWQVVSSPSPGTNYNYLNSVAAVSANDVWAVGIESNSSTLTLIENWNGTSWKVISSPNVGSSDNGLSGIAAVSADNFWAIGGYANTMGPFLTLTEEYS
jgi:hypothetical protein